MDLVNTEIIGSGILALILLWAIISVRHLKNLQKKIGDFWEETDGYLRKRHSLIPFLIETWRSHIDKEDLVNDLIIVRAKAEKEYFPNALKIEFEYDLTKQINALMEMARAHQEMKRDSNFMAVKKQIEDLEKRIEADSKKYNELVRKYNSHRGMWFLSIWAKLFGHRAANIFEFEV